MSQVSLRLLQLGAKVDQEITDKFSEDLSDYVQTTRLLRSWADDVKVPEEDTGIVCD
jgi:hypothetical protein